MVPAANAYEGSSCLSRRDQTAVSARVCFKGLDGGRDSRGRNGRSSGRSISMWLFGEPTSLQIPMGGRKCVWALESHWLSFNLQPTSN